MRACRTVPVLLTLLLTGTACTTGPALESQGDITAPPGDSRHLTIGSAGFTESDLLAQMYALLLDRAGLLHEDHLCHQPGDLRTGAGEWPDRRRTGVRRHLRRLAERQEERRRRHPVGSPDLDTTMKALRALAGPRGLTVLDPGRAVDQNAFAVAAPYAARHRLKTLSDLGRSGLPVRLAAGDECVQRPYCAPGLKKTYGIDITAVDPKGVGTTQAKQAVQSGRDQMVLTTTTDATLDNFGLVLLADDKHLQNADYLVPVVNRARVAAPGCATHWTGSTLC